MPYFDRAFTRVVVAPTVADLSGPTLLEIAAGVDVTAVLTDIGLEPLVTTITLDRIPWRGPNVVTVPVRRQSGFVLSAYREPAIGSDLAWNVAEFLAKRYLVVRRGVPVAAAWAAGQRVEVHEFQFGQRSNTGTGAKASTFTVPLYTSAFDDEAAVV